jgi:hypothetical protein
VQKEQLKLSNYYIRDDGKLMIEVQPGEFVSEAAARSGLVHSKVISDIERIKNAIKHVSKKKPGKVKKRY